MSLNISTTTRRIFLLQAAVAGGAALAAASASAQAPAAPATVTETDPTAAALGYVADTAKADQKKYPAHAATQKCSGCALYQGKAGEARGPCPIFAGKLVSSGGWCSSWVKKA
jgi:hypothetical protein